MRRPRPHLLVAALFLATSPAVAEFPSKERGLTADTAYQSGEIDHVNLFNGNLSVTIPVGRQYPLGPNLSYGLVLAYNSNVWDYSPQNCYDPINQIQIDYTLPDPDARSNAGLGWGLHLGRLFAPSQLPWNDGPEWVYLASDGSRHAFYNELHPGAGTQANTQFTNDGSYLRLRYFQDGDSQCKPVTGDTGVCRLVESPDGGVREFRNFIGDWRLTRLKDAFGNWLDIAYGATSWVLSDIHGRSHTIHFAGNRVSQVDLSGPDGTTASYTPTYTDTTIKRQSYTQPSCAPATHGNDVPVSLLTGLSQPDATWWSMAYYSQWAFDALSGGIKELRVPSGGKLEWTYQIYQFPSQSPTEVQTAWMNNAQGVETRTISWDPDDSQARGTWSYDYAAIGNPPDPGFPAISCFHRQRVTDPAGNVTDYFFSTLRSAHLWTYGLPFTYCDPASGAVAQTGPFLSERWYEGAATSANLNRSIWVEYTADGIASGNGSDQESNARVLRRKEVFHDDGDKYRETLRSDFDGLGNFRQTLVRGDFGLEKLGRVEYLPAGTLLINPESSTPLPGNNFSLPTGELWLFGLSTAQSITQRIDENDPGTTETCFSPTSGFLLRARTLAGSSRQPHDIVRVAVSEETGSPLRETGFVAEEKIYGGDGAAEGVGNGELCALSLPDDPEYWSKNTYSAGAMSRSVMVEPCDGITEIVSTLHQDIDGDTGLPLRIYDSADFGVSLTYDSMGRLVREDPDDGAAVLHLHSVPSPGSKIETPSYQVESCLPGVGGDDCPNDYRRLSSHSVYYDGLGRPTREAIAFLAAGQTELDQSREFERDVLGRTTFESTWQPPLGTAYSGYDRFGRVAAIEPSGEEAVRLSYVGERKITRELKVATTLASTSSVFTTETRDHFGRLISVCENQSAAPTTDACGGLLTRYSYDQEDRIVEVCHAAAGASCGQKRRFTFDGRGFLLAEQHPEIGRTTADWSRYTYDALGSVLTKDIDGTSDIPLRFRHDGAGRLLAVEENDGGWRPLKEFFYARNNDPGSGPFDQDWRAGKLFQTRRHNWVQAVAPLPQVAGDVDGIVTDTYTYKGRGGRVSEKQTSFRLLTGTTSFRTGFTYDLLGEIGSITYPRCNDWPCYGNDPLRQLTANRKLGFLQQIPGYATFDYQLGGSLPHHVQLENGIVWEQLADSRTAKPRPARISAKNSNNVELWSTGNYSYDGAGNIHALGNLGYQYDGFGRLQKEAQGATTRQLASYDNFGNLTNLTTAGSSFPIPVDAATNRLSGAGTTYRADGSLSTITMGGEPFAYTFDGIGQMKYLQSQGAARIFFYDANDDRLLAWDCPTGNCEDAGRYLRWTVRGLGGEVLRAYDETRRDNRRWLEDFVYQNGRLLAATRRNENGGEDRFAFALDHLGSTRQVYDWSGNLVESHNFYPFGQEVAAPGAADFVHKFTGHERDHNASGMGLLDYMHARYHSPIVGRFLTVDPAGAAPLLPQSWNRYSYVLNRPTIFKDPRGLFPGSEVGEFFRDLCFERGLCSDSIITVTATAPPFTKLLMPFFGYPTFGSEGKGILGTSPDASLFDFEANIREAQAMGIFDIVEFYQKSKTGGKWDVKQLCPSTSTSRAVPCQNFGNYHFGVIAAAAGVPLPIVLQGAGYYQVYSGRSRSEWIWPDSVAPPLTQPPYGDDPKDSVFIMMGWSDYQSFKDKP